MPLPEGMTALTIPNAEIREIFETTVNRWFDDKCAEHGTEDVLFDAVWNGDMQEL